MAMLLKDINRILLSLDGVLFLVTFGLCATTDRLDDLKFEERLNGNTFLTTFGESLMRCQDECVNRPRCKSINYRRLSMHCELNSAKESSDTALEEQSGWVYQGIAQWETESVCGNCNAKQSCETATSTCEIKECDPLLEGSGYRVFGNTNTVGAHALLACAEGQYPVSPETISEWPVTSECLENGTWTRTSLDCDDYKNNCSKYLASTTQWSRYKPTDVTLISGKCGMDTELTASSIHDNNLEFSPIHAKFEEPTKCWVAAVKSLDPNPYIQVTLPVLIEVKQIQTKGRPPFSTEFVTSYSVKYSSTVGCPSNSFSDALTKDGLTTFQGNIDGSNVKTNDFNTPLQALCVRLYILTHASGGGYQHPATKIELIGTIKLPVF